LGVIRAAQTIHKSGRTEPLPWKLAPDASPYPRSATIATGVSAGNVYTVSDPGELADRTEVQYFKQGFAVLAIGFLVQAFATVPWRDLFQMLGNIRLG
jgi:hypothetical protein